MLREEQEERRHKGISDIFYSRCFKTVNRYVMAVIIGSLIGFTVLGGCGANVDTTEADTVIESTEVYEQSEETDETLPETVPATEFVTEEPASEATEEPVTKKPVSEAAEEPVSETAESDTEPAHSGAEAQNAVTSTWIPATQAHPNLTPNNGLTLPDDRIIYNFAHGIAVGKDIDENVITTTEADYGFAVTIIDSNSVRIVPYNHTDKDLSVVSVIAAMETGDLASYENCSEYTVSGYADCTNGTGLIQVTFSDNHTLTAGVFKENDELFAVNITDNESRVATIVNARLDLAELLEKSNATEKDALFTDNIYYPIVPVAEGETTDTQYWLDKSFELVEPEWTDAHKVMVFYNYVIDNMAYDYWVTSNDTMGRFFAYNDYSGKYYISQTNMGICEDFANIIAIMCRAQEIPAIVMGNYNHAITVVYIEDYERWLIIDSTNSVNKCVRDEACTVQSCSADSRYKNIDYTSATNFTGLSIGNEADMRLQGIPLYYYNPED